MFSRRLPVDARAPGCWADVMHGEVVRVGVSGPPARRSLDLAVDQRDRRRRSPLHFLTA